MIRLECRSHRLLTLVAESCSNVECPPHLHLQHVHRSQRPEKLVILNRVILPSFSVVLSPLVSSSNVPGESRRSRECELEGNRRYIPSTVLFSQSKISHLAATHSFWKWGVTYLAGDSDLLGALRHFGWLRWSLSGETTVLAGDVRI